MVKCKISHFASVKREINIEIIITDMPLQTNPFVCFPTIQTRVLESFLEQKK